MGYHAYPFAGIEPKHHYAPQLDYYAARPLPPRPMPALYAPGADNCGHIYEMVDRDARATPAPEHVARRDNEPAYEAPAKAGKQKRPLNLGESAAALVKSL